MLIVITKKRGNFKPGSLRFNPNLFVRFVYYIIDAGSNIRPEPLEQIKAFYLKWFNHENYTNENITDTDWKDSNDLALLHLEKGFTRRMEGFKYAINTLCLPNANQINAEEQEATFYGWGKAIF